MTIIRGEKSKKGRPGGNGGDGGIGGINGISGTISVMGIRKDNFEAKGEKWFFLIYLLDGVIGINGRPGIGGLGSRDGLPGKDCGVKTKGMWFWKKDDSTKDYNLTYRKVK